MKNKQLQLVSFEQAKKLKEAGFNDEYVLNCKHYYVDRDNKLLLLDSSFGSKSIPCPTVALALKWFRDEKGIDNAVHIGSIRYEYSVDKVTQKTHCRKMIKCRLISYGHDSYELAESALLDELLTLIENKK